MTQGYTPAWVRALRALATITATVTEGVLAVGVVSTMSVVQVPRPPFLVVRGAFALLVGIVVAALVVGGLGLIATSMVETEFAATALLALIIVGPLLVLLYHAIMTVWAAIPGGYTASTSFMFLVGTLLILASGLDTSGMTD